MTSQTPILRILCTLLLCALISPVFAQGTDSLWYKVYGNLMDDIAFDVLEITAGEYLVVGKTEVSDSNWDGWIAKLDHKGDIIWENTYGGAQDEQLVSVCPALYQGFVVTGYTSTGAEGISDVWILYIDDNGDSLASVKYGSWSSDQAYRICPNVDQGYTITARSSIFQWGDQVYLLKLDVSMDTIWTKLYGYPYQDYGYWIEETSDYGYIIAGCSYPNSNPASGDAWAIRTDINGDTLWTKKYGGNDEDKFYAVTEIGDGYIFVGQTRSFNAVIIDLYVVRTDFDGNVVWSKILGGNGADYGYRIFPAGAGEFMIAGYSDSETGSRDVYMVMINIDGDVLWQDYFGDALDEEYFYGGTETSDGGYLLTGRLDHYGALMDDLFILKMGLAPGIDEDHGNHASSIRTYPNPADEYLCLELPTDVSGTVTVSVYDLNGQLYETCRLTKVKLAEIDVGYLPQGLYICRVTSGAFKSAFKFVVRRSP